MNVRQRAIQSVRCWWVVENPNRPRHQSGATENDARVAARSSWLIGRPLTSKAPSGHAPVLATARRFIFSMIRLRATA